MKTITQKLNAPVVVFLLFLSVSVNAQHSIAGTVNSTTNEPLLGSTVLLLQQADSSLVKANFTNQEGYFSFDGIVQGKYLLSIGFVGFETTMQFAETGKDPLSYSLVESSSLLDQVNVVAQKPLFEIQADKIVFNVAASPSASGTNGLDLMRQSPGVALDMDNNISLLGRGGVQIYINGRPSRLTGNDLALFLQSLTSDNIESFEIISNPSSKYDAEGSGGIINIKIKKNVSLGFNGVATANVSKGNYYRSSAGLTLNYGGEKINATARVTRSDADIQDDLFDTKDQNGFFIDSKSFSVNTQNSYNIDLGLDAQLSEKHSLNFSGAIIPSRNNNILNNSTSIFKGTAELREILISKTDLNATTNNYNFNIGHRWNVSSSENFSADVSYGNFNTDRNTDQPNTFFGPDGEQVMNVLNTSFDANTGIKFYAINADYEKNWEKVSFSTGAKYGIINTDNAFDFFNIPNNLPVFDETRSNQFTYLEKVLALYSTANIKLNKSYKLSLGLRMENTDSRGQLFSNLPVNNKDVPRNYTDFFPNVGLSFNDQKVHAWSLSMGRRITRPSYTDLNPFITPQSQLLVWEGNPFLRPNYIMNYQFMYTLKQSLTITNSYSVTKDFFATIFEIVGENGNRIIPQNMRQSTSYAVSISYPLKVNKFWNVTSFVNGSYNTFNGDLNGTLIDLTATIYNLSIQNNFKLPGGFNMDLSYYRFSDLIWRGSILVKGNQGVNVGLRKEFFEKKLQVNLTGSDIFRTNSDYFYQGDYGGIITDGVRTFDNQRFGISAALKFGNQKVKTRNRSSDSLKDELRRLNGTE